MDIQLYVYDLSQGMARQYSLALTGIQIDAIYHTAVVFGGVEYFFGQGVHRKIPGSTHHGQPMRIIRMGTTELPPEIIEDYVQSLESIYTPESYDLFLHNCNNFSQDLCMFLVGKSIPEEISSLPETFLKTPIGQMLRGQLDQSMRRMTQAPDAIAGQNVQRRNSAANAVTTKASAKSQGPALPNGKIISQLPGHVHYPQNTTELDVLLSKASSSCAVIFFTSATCPPCRIVYPAYDQLAEEAGSSATLIKVDVSKTYDIAARYQIRATPTFMTFLNGRKEEEWAGADEARLRGTVRLLVQMANPEHPHTRLRLPSFHNKIEKPIIYAKVPPLDKLLAKIGPVAKDKPVEELVSYIKSREQTGLENTPLPDLAQFSTWAATKFAALPPEIHFAVIDLLRVSAADPRVSSYLAAEPDLRILHALIPQNTDYSQAPYALQSVTLQLLCNLSSSSVFHDLLINQTGSTSSKDPPALLDLLDQVTSQTLLSAHPKTRTLAAALLYNLATHTQTQTRNHNHNQPISLPDTEPALIQAIINETTSRELLHVLLLALGALLYRAPPDASLFELCAVMDLRAALRDKAREAVFKGEPLLDEMAELLGKGSVASS